MAVNLLTLVPTLRRAVNPPGQDFHAGTGTNEWRGRLADAFWKARLNDFFAGYAVSEDGLSIVPIEDGLDDLDRRDQELVVQFAALTALTLKIMSLPTSSHAKAGPVETETQRSAAVFVQLLKQLTLELNRTRDAILLARAPRAVAFFDSLVIATNRFVADYDVYGFVN